MYGDGVPWRGPIEESIAWEASFQQVAALVPLPPAHACSRHSVFPCQPLPLSPPPALTRFGVSRFMLLPSPFRTAGWSSAPAMWWRTSSPTWTAT
jgi:hypothetical protein